MKRKQSWSWPRSSHLLSLFLCPSLLGSPVEDPRWPGHFWDNINQNVAFFPCCFPFWHRSGVACRNKWDGALLSLQLASSHTPPLGPFLSWVKQKFCFLAFWALCLWCASGVQALCASVPPLSCVCIGLLSGAVSWFLLTWLLLIFQMSARWPSPR